MTKKDYELIASAFNRKIVTLEPNTPLYSVVADTAIYLATELQEENDKFNSEKFLEACGIKD